MAVGLASAVAVAQTVSDMEKQKQTAEQEIRETKAQLNANEKKVNQGLSALRKLDDEITATRKEIETVTGQIEKINANIADLETSIDAEEADLRRLREEYLKAVKRMRVSRKETSELAFLFSSGSFNEARRRMRYMKEFSDWKERRSTEIEGKVASLKEKKELLAQARNDASVALGRQKAAQDKLTQQRSRQQTTVDDLRKNSDALRDKLAKRQAEAKKLSGQISRLIAEQREKEAREAGQRRKEEEKRLAAEKAAAEKAAAEKKAEEEKNRQLAENSSKNKNKKSKKEEKKQSAAPSNEPASSSEEVAESRKRSRQPSASATAVAGFEGMRGRLPRPVNGSFKIVSPFGVHPISPELPDIMDENLGIDAHVANGASVQSVYDGEVLKIYDRTNTPGFRNIVVVKHGDYLTVYANLETLSVKSGQTIKQGQTLGTVGADFDDPDYGLIHFEIWKNQNHLDPAGWIKL